jgi:putative toxin-antitoxin system antitoxin component (TIGR02293 family)
MLKGAIVTEAPVIARKRAAAHTKPAVAHQDRIVTGGPKERARRLDYLTLYRAAPLERIKRVKAGISAAEAKAILSDLAIPSGRISAVLGIPVSTLNRKAKVAQKLSTDEGERVLGLAKLVGQVQAMVEDSGDPKGFDARAWTAHWLNTPLPALGGVRPVDLMDTMEGQGLVSETLARIQSGAYA